MQEIANMVYSIVHIPIMIADTDHRTITYSGLSEEKYLELEEDMENFFQENGAKDFFHKGKSNFTV